MRKLVPYGIKAIGWFTRYTSYTFVTLSATVLLLHAIMLISNYSVRTAQFTGPFAPIVSNSVAVQVPLSVSGMHAVILETDGDTPSSPYRSGATVTANGLTLGPPHSQHLDIHEGKTPGAYSHWGNAVIFSLPTEISNSSATVIAVQHRLVIKSVWLESSILVLMAAALYVIMMVKIAPSDRYDKVAVVVMKVFFPFLKFCAVGVILGCIFFVYMTLQAYSAGYGVPTTAIFYQNEFVRYLAIHEPRLPHLVILSALVGFAITSGGRNLPTSGQLAVEGERWVTLTFTWIGIPVLSALFLFALSAAWSGIPRKEDYLFGATIIGLVPFSDAADHFNSSFYQTFSGDWGAFGSRRPIASALRAVLMSVVDYSLPRFLVLQACALAGATYLATRATMNCWGPWAGLTFLGLTLITIRPYLFTTLTEPLALTLSLLSIPLLLLAFQKRSFQAKTGFVLLSSAALLVRMGNMFFIPFVAAWAILSKSDRWEGQRIAKLLLIGAALSSLVALNTTLSVLYNAKSGAMGGNFALTFCGLTHGGDWTICPRIYGAELASRNDPATGTEAFTSIFYYQKAFDQLRNVPEIFTGRLFDGAIEFAASTPALLLLGYRDYMGETGFPYVIWFYFSLAIVLVRLYRSAETAEVSFWVVLVFTLLVSSAVVYFDDGKRVLSASYPLLALLLSSAYVVKNGSPSLENAIPIRIRGDRTLLYPYAVAAVLGAIAMLMVPWASREMDKVELRSLVSAVKKQGNLQCHTQPDGCAIFLPIPLTSGFVVIPDGTSYSRSVPTVNWSDFRKVMVLTGIEQYGNLGPKQPSTEPFAIAFGVGLNDRGHSISKILIAPPQLLLEQAHGWRLTLQGQNPYWRNVTELESLQVPE